MRMVEAAWEMKELRRKIDSVGEQRGERGW
jgi:hypothetical protein